MRSFGEHQAQETRNWEFYGRIDGQKAKHSEWAMTVIFYAAVHHTTAFLAGKGRRVGSHADRQRQLRLLKKDDAADTYEQLFQASRKARYECQQFTSLELFKYEALAKDTLPTQLK